MQQLRSVVLALSVLWFPTLAHADDEEAARRAQLDMGIFANRVAEATTSGMFGNNNFAQPVSECTDAVKRGTDAGLEASDTFEDSAGKVTLWKRAGEVCEQYARLQKLGATIDTISPQLSTIAVYAESDGSPIKSVTGDAYRDTVKTAQTCVDNIDKAIKAGVLTDVAFLPSANYGEVKITLSEARTKCKTYIDWGTKAADADDKRQAEETAALRAKWSKLGASGDRLAYLIANGHHIILGKGCKELSDKQKTTSAVFYEVYSDDTSWIVYKTQWKKHKKTGSSDRRFRRDGGYSCK
jgi:hypothetical protein